MAKTNILKKSRKTYIFSHRGSGGESGINVTPLTVTENGTYTSAEGQAYSPVTVRVEGDVEVEDNKSVSISENGTVVINPTSGKDAMAKVTATVNVTPALETKTITENGTYTPTAGKDGFSEVVVNVSGGGDSGSASVYAWRNTNIIDSHIFLNVDKAPDLSSDANKMKILYFNQGVFAVDTFMNFSGGTYTKISDTQFQIDTGGPEPDVYERVSEDDVIIWEGEGGGNTTAYTWHGYFEDATQHQEMDMGILYFDFSSAPATQSDFMSGHTFDPDEYLKVVTNEGAFSWANITEYTVSEGAIHMTGEVGNYRFVRDSSKDLSIWEASGDITVEPLSVTENGTYTAPSGKAYTPVTVNVPSADIEENKAATIDVSQYSTPVEIIPSSGKAGMAKATVTLSNIPTESDIETEKTVSITQNGTYTINPTTGKDAMAKVTATVNVATATVEGTNLILSSGSVSGNTLNL